MVHIGKDNLIPSVLFTHLLNELENNCFGIFTNNQAERKKFISIIAEKFMATTLIKGNATAELIHQLKLNLNQDRVLVAAFEN